MNIRQYINLITLFTLAIIFPVSSFANNVVTEIAQYVSPLNIPSSPKAFTYMPDGTSYLSLSNDGRSIIKYDLLTGNEIETVINIDKCRGEKIGSIAGFQLSSDTIKMLIYNNVSPIYRHSFTAKYYVYEIKRNMLTKLSEKHEFQQSPIFSNDARMVAFVAENNIYIKKLDYNTEVAVTTDGRYNEIINGIPDWTYEEEFSNNTSMAWSPDNTTLCFVKYNESKVKTYSFPLYMGACNPKQEYEFYPGSFTYKYPVAGETNSKVSLHSYDVETRKVKNITLPDDNIEYIPRIYFGNATERLIVPTLNRAQNHLEIYSVNPKSTVVKSIYVEDSKSWISPETYETIKFYNDYFILTSERSGYFHIYQYSYNGNQIRQITSGDYDITSFYGIDLQGNIYFQSTANGPLNRIISKMDKKGIISNLSPREGYSIASFSPSMNHFMLNYSNTSTPPVYKIVSTKGKEIRIVESNSEYAQKHNNLPQTEFFTFNNNGVTLNGYMIKPLDFTPSKKYPVIMTQYSGPASQQVLNRWKLDWEQYFAKKGYIVVCVDGRGTGGRGLDFKSIVYKKLGHYETIDQIAAANYVASLPYVNKSQIGICGWSYGGYETLMAISHEASPYAAAVAIAPVTDWRYYDTVYAERFMLTPNENEDGYDNGSPMKKAANVNCPLLLMSGTADDNVHFQNTLEYVAQLQANGILCDMYIFPNMNHSINYCNGRALVYAKMFDYFNRNMK